MTFDFVKVTIKSRFLVGSTINFVHYVDIIDFCNHYLETLFTIRNAKIDISSQIVDVGNNMCQRKINVDIVVNIDRDCAEIENVLNRMAQSRTNTVTPIAIHVKKCPNK